MWNLSQLSYNIWLLYCLKAKLKELATWQRQSGWIFVSLKYCIFEDHLKKPQMWKLITSFHPNYLIANVLS